MRDCANKDGSDSNMPAARAHACKERFVEDMEFKRNFGVDLRATLPRRRESEEMDSALFDLFERCDPSFSIRKAAIHEGEFYFRGRLQKEIAH